jgi:arylsulfatase A-like enzyme
MSIRGSFLLVLTAGYFAGITVNLRATEHPRSGSRPNFVVFLVDDLGATDLGCTGSGFYETPNIDRLAAGGMRFTTAYSACTVCSPTRAALMTGKYPARLRITDFIAGHKRPFAKLLPPDWTMHLPLEEVTLAERLKTAGYATAAIGKWHLGGPVYWPEGQGFDVNIAGGHYGQPPSYFDPFGIQTLENRRTGEYLTDRLTDEAVAWIESNRDRPFFLYFPHYTVHTPLQAKPAVIEKYQRKAATVEGPHKNPRYAAMIESLDQSVGRVVDKLSEIGIREKPVIVFTSDNGGLLQSTTNLGLRDGKGSAYEGGIRVPLIIDWPGITKAGSTCDVPVITQDLFHTVVDIAGLPLNPTDNGPRTTDSRDGLSLVPLLKGSSSLARDALYWHYPHYHIGGARPYGAIRSGNYRLIEFFEGGPLELYNLDNDPLEQTNLAQREPERAKTLQNRLAGWRASIGAQMPRENPNYDPEKAAQGPAKK